MKIVFYKIQCLTNLHVGAGEVNYNIIDNEVEKDAVSGLPVIHASGIKGALREAFSNVEKYKGQIDTIFGKSGEGDEMGGG
ncbi:MAG: type III-B CRISPR module RAMP protein Cmr4, partial [Clostridia bacterium]|nr:type III-B CRISPR module RAMP protein Cmr4 [Clostridia bacterium]